MLVLTAPTSDDPRPDGFNHALPGELLHRPYVCDAGQDRGCGCERAWAGVSSRKATTLAHVVNLPITEQEYIATLGRFLMDTWGWQMIHAYDEARMLAELATSCGAGALVTIDTQHDQQVFDVLETDRG